MQNNNDIKYFTIEILNINSLIIFIFIDLYLSFFILFLQIFWDFFIHFMKLKKARVIFFTYISYGIHLFISGVNHTFETENSDTNLYEALT